MSGRSLRSPAAARSASRVLPTPPIQRQQPGAGQQPLDLGQLTAAADEAGQLRRQIPGYPHPLYRNKLAPRISREGSAQALPLNAHLLHNAGAPRSAGRLHAITVAPPAVRSRSHPGPGPRSQTGRPQARQIVQLAVAVLVRELDELLAPMLSQLEADVPAES